MSLALHVTVHCIRFTFIVHSARFTRTVNGWVSLLLSLCIQLDSHAQWMDEFGFACHCALHKIHFHCALSKIQSQCEWIRFFWRSMKFLTLTCILHSDRFTFKVHSDKFACTVNGWVWLYLSLCIQIDSLSLCIQIDSDAQWMDEYRFSCHCALHKIHFHCAFR